ncbi:MAG: hypothetical protein CL910_21530 [Deltaproteobacteria bacterium]|jgi:hypothetical protein|nr:hypothetical protein [Deltaproteobacteria bacterium]
MTLRNLAALLLLGGLSAGCASHVDRHWGESYRTLTRNQIENPDAGADPSPVEGLSATSADHVTTSYHERRSTPVQDHRVDRSTVSEQLGQ